MPKVQQNSDTLHFFVVHFTDMERKFGTVLVMCVVLEVVLCAPIQEFEAVQSPGEVSAGMNIDI